MKTWLLNWVPDYSNLPEPFGKWPKSKKIIDDVHNGETYTENWRCSSTQVEIGDKVYLIKIGKIDKKQKGIIASGTAVSKNYVRADGSRSIDVEFDRIIDHFTHDILPLDLLEREYPNQTWSSQSSGIEVLQEYTERLQNDWNNFTPTIKPFFEELLKSSELEPEKHDGAYELVQEIVKAYSKLESFTDIDYNDLNLIYLMTIISESKNRNKKLSLVDYSHLRDSDKLIIKNKINHVFDKSENREYINRSGDRDTVGMFGTGFHTFRTKSNNESAQSFIKLCVDIYNLSDENIIFEKVKRVFDEGVNGLGSASASQILHCLKPLTFPIVNKGNGPKIYGEFGIKFDRYMEIKNYISYVYQIKEIRDDYFTFKNYRIFDIVGEKTQENSIRLKPTNIDLLSVLVHIENNHNKNYEKPERVDDALKREELESLRTTSQNAVNELRKVASICSHDYGLSKLSPIQWLDGSNTKIRGYLWLQMRYPNTSDIHSISLFTEYMNGKARFRVALELRNDKADISDYNRHHKSLELPLDEESGLVYVSGSNESEISQEFTDRDLALNNITNGIFKKVQVSKIILYDENTSNDDLADQVFAAIEAILPYYNHILNDEVLIDFEETQTEVVEEGVSKMQKSIEQNLILYGPPGTGKTYNSKNIAVAICENKSINDIDKEDYSEIQKRYDAYVDQGRIAFTTFHQSYGYEEFIEGIHPEVNDQSQVVYKTKSGIFKSFCKAESDNDLPRVFIIDEINRGNISKIFGELITLIEDIKREGAKEAMSVILPYSREVFSVPKNVYILGTMNTADRSIALMDTALRRRFAFEEMMPKPELIEKYGVQEIDGLNITKMLEVINDRIEVLYDREHTIGHAFFMDKEMDLDKLSHIFKNKIVPLLQEYFYEDYEKIEWILGDNAKTDESIKFIKKIRNEKALFKGNIDMNIIPEYRYEININAFSKIESYKKIF